MVGQGTTVDITFPVSSAESFGTPDIVLIDNDQLTHWAWGLQAKQMGIKLLKVYTSDEFEKIAPQLSKETPVFIDSDLGNDIHGENLAPIYREKYGFKFIFLETAYEKLLGKRLPGIDAVVGKNLEQAIATLKTFGFSFES